MWHNFFWRNLIMKILAKKYIFHVKLRHHNTQLLINFKFNLIEKFIQGKLFFWYWINKDYACLTWRNIVGWKVAEFCVRLSLVLVMLKFLFTAQSVEKVPFSFHNDCSLMHLIFHNHQILIYFFNVIFLLVVFWNLYGDINIKSCYGNKSIFLALAMKIGLYTFSLQTPRVVQFPSISFASFCIHQ